MMDRFFKEERGQSTIEYVLMMGGVMMATIVIYGVYSGMTVSAEKSLNTTTNNATDSMVKAIENSI